MSASIPPSTPGKPWQPPALEDLAPELPQYEILGLLGRGGMGAVYKARQKSLNREVAIKVLPPMIDDGEMRYGERFISEAQSMAKLEHPDIVAVYDAGQTPGGLLYFVMQYVQGTDVAQMIAASGKLPPEHAYAITAHVCEALDYAHRHGIIHRDIKPANIMVDMEGRVKVADFGLAKAVDANTGFTKSDMAVGTPDFFAPESLTPGMSVDGRADLYAVGVMLYQMLTGKIPRGSWQPASVLSPGTDPRFDEIILKAMQYDPQERHSSASELRQHLDTLLLPAVPAPELQQYSSAQVRKTPRAQPQAAAPGPGRVRQNVGAPATPSAKSKAPLFIGIATAVVITIGAFAMVGGDKHTKQVASLDSASEMSLATASKPANETEQSTTPPSIKASESAKPDPKPVVVAKTPEPPKPTDPTPLKEEPSTTAPVSAPVIPPAPVNPPVPVLSTAKSSDQILPPGQWALPPGQWVKVFTKFEDLPEDLRKPGSSVKFEDGWITGSKRLNFRSFHDGREVNVAVRFTVKGAARGGGGFLCVVALRHDDLETRSVYTFRQLPDTMHFARVQFTKKKKDELFPPKTFLTAPGQPWTIEFGVVGSRLIARRNGSLLPVETDAIIQSGWPGYIDTLNAIRDIEVINLDGIPEAEALQILGVDEKGNDLRAIAAKQQQQWAEQAKEADAIATIPELKTLHEQFVKLQAERVTEPFEADLAKLNTGYLGGLDREISRERGKGNLDGVIVLEAEKKLLSDKEPLPADDDLTPEALKKLRGIYRSSLAKLENQRSANLKALTDPLSIRLRQLESTLTQQNRIEPAKTVRVYREHLGENRSPVAVTPVPALRPMGPGAIAPTPISAPSSGTDPAAVRKAVDWVLGLRGTIRLIQGGVEKTINDATAVPKGELDVRAVIIEGPGAAEVTDENIRLLAALKDLRILKLNGTAKTRLTKLEALAGLKEMEELNIEWNKEFKGPGITDAELTHLSGMKKLTKLELGASGINGTGLAQVPRGLTFLSIRNSVLSDKGIAMLGNFPSLTALNTDGTEGFTTENIAPLRSLKGITATWTFFGLHELVGDWENLTELKVGPLSFGSLPSDEVLRKLAAFPKLHAIWIFNVDITNEDIIALFGATNLKVLHIQNGAGGSDGTAFAQLRRAKDLVELAFKGSQITDSGLKAIATSCPALTKLNIDSPNPLDKNKPRQFTATGLAELAGLRELTSLGISGSALDETGWQTVAEIGSLTEISVQRSNIDDTTLMHLKKLRNLKKVDAKDSAVTAEGAAAFKKARPDVEVLR